MPSWCMQHLTVESLDVLLYGYQYVLQQTGFMFIYEGAVPVPKLGNVDLISSVWEAAEAVHVAVGTRVVRPDTQALSRGT